MTYQRNQRSFGGPKRSFRPSRGYSGGGGSGGGRRRFGRKKQWLFDPNKLVKKSDYVKTDAPSIPIENSFESLVKNPTLRQNIIKVGYTTPTSIQDKGIPLISEGRDVVGLANTGTGKTGAFLIPIIEHTVANRNKRTLIIVPTRELAVQVNTVSRSLTVGLGIGSLICIGGVGFFQQKDGLRRGPNIVIGTPGRLKDLFQQGNLKLAQFNTVILDEVDRMLDMGFIHDVRFLIGQLPKERQSLFFSATLSPEVKNVMNVFLKNPVMVSVKTQEIPLNVDQDVIRVAGGNKVDILHGLLIKPEYDKVLVFGQTKWGIEKLAKNLEQRGFRVEELHGNKSQNNRQRALERFRSGQVQVLLATDVASRGLDIENVSHVINYDLPESYEDYVHRIGRTGRADKKGYAITFVD